MDLVKKFISEADKQKIRQAVAAAEKRTSGEIVPMIVSSSYHYPMAGVVGAVVFALPSSVLLTPALGGFFWIGQRDMWIFLAVFSIFFMVFRALLERAPALKRIFVSGREIEEEVSEAAAKAFFRERLYQTRDETGVLIFISIFEHKVWVLADRGIDQKVEPGSWDRIVALIVSGIKARSAGEAICKAVDQVADLLESHFPRRSGDENELRNLIVE